MHQLVPPGPHGEVTALEALADPPVAAGRPAVRVCMVQTLDGVAAIDGTSSALGSDADHAFFLACRSLADTVLVGAQTLRAEGYGPAKLTPELVVARQSRGQPPLPRIAVVSRSLDLDPDGAFFTEARAEPIVVTCAASPPDRRARLERRARVVVAGDDAVDLPAALDALGRDGCRLVGCEGGPTLNAHLFAAGLVDELCLSVAPQIAGEGPRIVSTAPAAIRLSVHRCLIDGDALFLRLRPDGGPR